jgi:hypothetical protein
MSFSESAKSKIWAFSSTADAVLVAVGLRRIDVAVAELECPANRVLALRPTRSEGGSVARLVVRHETGH